MRASPMVSHGGVTTSICDCSISVITRSPSWRCTLAKIFLSMRRAARRFAASNRKYSSSMPIVYMRATTRSGTLSSAPDLCNGRPSMTGRPLRVVCGETAQLAGRLAATGRVDLFAQTIEADSADDDIVADDVTRRAVEAQRLGQLHVLVERLVDFGALHVLLQFVHVEPDLLGDCEGALAVDMAAAAEHLGVEFKVLLAGLVLHAHGDGDLGSRYRGRPEHREILEHYFQIWVRLQQRDHVSHGVLAVGAIVIEKFDQRDVALRITERHLIG